MERGICPLVHHSTFCILHSAFAQRSVPMTELLIERDAFPEQRATLAPRPHPALRACPGPVRSAARMRQEGSFAGRSGESRVTNENAECRTVNGEGDLSSGSPFNILHSAFCILHSPTGASR